jgi:hypothetical protein
MPDFAVSGQCHRVLTTTEDCVGRVRPGGKLPLTIRLLTALALLGGVVSSSQPIPVTADGTAPVHVVRREFASTTIDVSLLFHAQTCDLTSPVLVSILPRVSPVSPCWHVPTVTRFPPQRFPVHGAPERLSQNVRSACRFYLHSV